jgi:hypothetical protein
MATNQYDYYSGYSNPLYPWGGQQAAQTVNPATSYPGWSGIGAPAATPPSQGWQGQQAPGTSANAVGQQQAPGSMLYDIYGNLMQTPSTSGQIYGGGGGTSASMGAYGGMGASGQPASAAANMAQQMMKMILAGQTLGAGQTPGINETSEKLYKRYYKPDVNEFRRKAGETQEKYRTGLWDKGMGFSSEGARKMEEAGRLTEEEVTRMVRDAKLQARQQAIQDLQYQESSPTQMMGQLFRCQNPQDAMARLRELLGYSYPINAGGY